MITSLKLTNYRSHGDTEIRLQPLTVLVGPAGAGKSNLFKALVLLQNSVHRSLVELFPPGLGEFQWVRSRWADEESAIGLEVELTGMKGLPDSKAHYQLRVADAPEGLFVSREDLDESSKEGGSKWVFRRDKRKTYVPGFGEIDPHDRTLLNMSRLPGNIEKPDLPAPQFARAVASSLSRSAYYHLEASRLKALGTGQSRDRIGYNGEWLPDFIAWTKSEEQASGIYKAILEAMQELLPHLDSIIVTQTGPERQGIAFSFKGHQGYIAAPDLSDGTVFTLGMLCIVHSPQKPFLLCIEEPETGLHPRRLRWLFDKLCNLAYPNDGTEPVQVLLTTHSPYFVNLFKDIPECVQIVEHHEGRSRIRSLPDIQAELHLSEPGSPIGHDWATGLYENL